MTYPKRIVEGKVGVVISPSYGFPLTDPAHPELNFDPKLVDLVANGLIGDAIAYLRKKNPDYYYWDDMSLQVVWLSVGTKFTIEEYDGSEYIITEEDLHLTA